MLTRDLFPYEFLDFIWSAKICLQNEFIRPGHKAVGFKSFPEHWTDVRNEHVWQDAILEDLRVKKIILHRKDELAVYVSQLRADETGRYMTHRYPEDLTFTIDPAHFQSFLDRYRHTFRKKYKSPIVNRDTFWINYEDLCDHDAFRENIFPELCKFLGVSGTSKMKLLRETVKQAKPDEDLSKVIENYDELEFCFRHSDVLHFANKRGSSTASTSNNFSHKQSAPLQRLENETWSILLPICSRSISLQAQPRHSTNQKSSNSFNVNRFSELSKSSQHNSDIVDDAECWELLRGFCDSLKKTATPSQLKNFECIVGIDVDDPVYQPEKDKLKEMIPCKVVFVDIQPEMYGKLCRIWNLLAASSSNDYIVLFGDDIRLCDAGWSQRIAARFHDISNKSGLPLGAAVVAFNDLAFPGFPTFPVVHRWHVRSFGQLLPKQFVNQGGDPFLYELYSRLGTAGWEVSCRLENTIGGMLMFLTILECIHFFTFTLSLHQTYLRGWRCALHETQHQLEGSYTQYESTQVTEAC